MMFPDLHARAALVVLLAGCEPIGDPQRPTRDTVLVQTTADFLEVTEPVERIAITAVSGNVEVNAGAEGLVTAEKIGTADDALAFELEGTTLHLRAQCPNGAPGCGAGVQLFAPASTALEVSTSSGAISANSGLAGDLALTTATGSVTTRGRIGGSTVVVSDSGPVSLAWAGQPISLDVTTVSGSVDIVLQPGTYAFDVQSNNEVVVPEEGLIPGAGPPIRVRSESGTVTVRTVSRR